MKLKPMTWMLLATTVILGGCSVDQYANMILKRDTWYGKGNENLLGSSEQMVRNGRIFAARNYKMPDDVDIDVWIIKAPPNIPQKGTVLILHGLGDSKAAHLRLAKKLKNRGFDVVLPDLRVHGRSTGKYVTYGAIEKHDQKRVMDKIYAEGLVQEPLYVFGVTMGASVAIQYGAIDPRVKGVMAMVPSRDFRTLAKRFVNRFNLLISDEDFEQVLVRCGEIGNFHPNDASALDAAAKLTCPLLLVHGKLDTIVPHADSVAIRDAAGGPVELELPALLGHLGVLVGRENSVVADIERLAAGEIGKATPPSTQPTE